MKNGRKVVTFLIIVHAYCARACEFKRMPAPLTPKCNFNRRLFSDNRRLLFSKWSLLSIVFSGLFRCRKCSMFLPIILLHVLVSEVLEVQPISVIPMSRMYV